LVIVRIESDLSVSRGGGEPLSQGGRLYGQKCRARSADVKGRGGFWT
jgi:hypothetical protein